MMPEKTRERHRDDPASGSGSRNYEAITRPGKLDQLAPNVCRANCIRVHSARVALGRLAPLTTPTTNDRCLRKADLSEVRLSGCFGTMAVIGWVLQGMSLKGGLLPFFGDHRALAIYPFPVLRRSRCLGLQNGERWTYQRGVAGSIPASPTIQSRQTAAVSALQRNLKSSMACAAQMRSALWISVIQPRSLAGNVPPVSGGKIPFPGVTDALV
jgi:hypothetical protein